MINLDKFLPKHEKKFISKIKFKTVQLDENGNIKEVNSSVNESPSNVVAVEEDYQKIQDLIVHKEG